MDPAKTLEDMLFRAFSDGCDFGEWTAEYRFTYGRKPSDEEVKEFFKELHHRNSQVILPEAKA